MKDFCREDLAWHLVAYLGIFRRGGDDGLPSKYFESTRKYDRRETSLPKLEDLPMRIGGNFSTKMEVVRVLK